MPVVYWYDSKKEGEERGGNFIREEDGKFRYEFFAGCVVNMYEHNGYHDSYFYAIIYLADEDRVIEHEYAATAYAGGGNAWVDASDVLKAKYQEHLARKAIETQHKQIESVYEQGVSAIFCARLWKRLGKYQYFDACLNLLKTKNFRSEFRKSLRNQLEQWLLDDQPKFSVPFSDRQSSFLRPNRSR